VWAADGRTNAQNAGRHSLGTKVKSEAVQRLYDLDQHCAIELGLIESPERHVTVTPVKLSIAEGRQLFEQYIRRPQVTGGVKTSTQKRYRAAFNKFERFAGKTKLLHFNDIDLNAFYQFGTYLEALHYAPKTIHNELTTLKVCIKWLVKNGHLSGYKPIEMPLRRPESQRAYCYRQSEVFAILERCRSDLNLQWLGGVVTALACTGMRIDELVHLKWSDIDPEHRLITLTEESNNHSGGRSLKSGKSRSFPIHDDLISVLAAIHKSDAYIFHGPRGGRLKADTVRRVLVRDVIVPLAPRFKVLSNGKSFADGRLHSFRHYFVSVCAMKKVPERVVMEWVGHADSAMVRHYFHLHDEEAHRQMKALDLLGNGHT